MSTAVGVTGATGIRALPKIPVRPRSFAQVCAQLSIFTMLCLAVTFPGISVTTDLKVKAEQVLVLPICFVFALLLLAGLVRPIRFNGMFVLGALFCICIMISMAYGADILGHRLIQRDFYEIPKVWFPVLFFTVAYESNLSEKSLRRLLAVFAVPMLLVCFYGWAQFLHMSFVTRLNPYYSGGLHIDLGLERQLRIFSTMGNANILGMLLTWTLGGYTMAFLFRVGSRALNLVVALCCLVTLVMTGSRYGLLTSVVALAMIFAMASAAGRKRLRPLLILILVLPLFGVVFQYVGTRYIVTSSRFQELKKPLEVRSVRQRLDDLWVDAIDYFRRSPILGHGPAKTIFTGVYTDSEYLNILKFYGVVGFVPYLGYYLFPMFLIWKGLKASRRAGPQLEDRVPATVLHLRLAMIMSVTALVMNVGETTYLNPEIQGLLWIWLGLGAHSAETIAALTRSRRLALAPILEAGARFRDGDPRPSRRRDWSVAVEGPQAHSQRGQS